MAKKAHSENEDQHRRAGGVTIQKFIFYLENNQTSFLGFQLCFCIIYFMHRIFIISTITNVHAVKYLGKHIELTKKVVEKMF